jgi:hypothetical protein
MIDLNDFDWNALENLRTARSAPDPEILAKLASYGLVVKTPRGVWMISGLGKDSLTLFRHGIKPSISRLEIGDDPTSSEPGEMEIEEISEDDPLLPAAGQMSNRHCAE